MKTKLALALIVKPTDDEADALDKCLKYASPSVDGIFVTITGKNKKVEEIAKNWGAVVSHTEWENDFAKARNFNFAQVPKEYTHILWLDADDVLRESESLRELIEKHQDVDAFYMSYLYAFDEYKQPVVVHLKAQILKNNDSVTWKGKIHEDFVKNRQIKVFIIDPKIADRLHLTTEDRVNVAKDRNLEIAQTAIEDEPDEPRHYWNLANGLRGVNRVDEAAETFKEFIKRSSSDDEKYLARCRIAEIYLGKNKLNDALDSAQSAIGIRPDYPDAYHLAGTIYFTMKNYTRARDMYQQGLTKKPPTSEILVYNPRDYDYTPLMNLAKTYFNLSMPTLALKCLESCLEIYPDHPDIKDLVTMMQGEAEQFEEITDILNSITEIEDKEELKKALDEVPEELRSHPAICSVRNQHFIKETSSGKDMVYMCGHTDFEWNPDVAQSQGVGGSEEAVIHLTRKWKDLGWNVTVYANCGYKAKEYDGVMYRPFWEFNHRDKQDVTILWRSPALAEYELNSKKIFVDLHDTIPEGEFTPERMKKIDKIFVKSDFHRSLYPSIDDKKFAVIPNGIDPVAFEEDMERDPMLMINTSSPDRSLGSLLDCYERVKKEVPEAKLVWAYGWDLFQARYNNNGLATGWMEAVNDRMKELGVINLGKISHEEVRKLYLRANIFAYPTEFAEIHCISAAKAQAGGAIPVTTDFAALAETVKYGSKIKSKKTKDDWFRSGKFHFGIEDEDMKDAWVKKVVGFLKEPMTEKQRQPMRKWARKQFDWQSIAEQWNEVF